MRYEDRIVEEVQSLNDIVEVISGYIPLRRAGKSFKAVCPFHNEKTASFMVSPEKQIWHCFGCSKGGDQFTFIQEMEGVEFPEALRILAKRAGIQLTYQNPEHHNQKTRLLDLCRLAADYWHEVLLKSDEAGFVRDYLKQRAVSEATASLFNLGYAKDEWEDGIKYFQQKGFSLKEVADTGLSVINAKGKPYDRFRGRLIFPIRDVHGNTVGFTARKMKEADQGGKYVNSPQNLIYNKSGILYNLDLARQEIKRLNYAILVEGNMDALSSYQAGTKNVIAVSGTALTEDQITLLKRYSINVMISFDADVAGTKANLRGIDLAWQAGFNVKVIHLPVGQDPDDLIKQSPEQWKRLVKQASNFMDYIFQVTFQELDLSRVDHKKLAAKKILPIIKKLGDGVERDHYLKKLSTILEVSEDSLINALRDIKDPAKKTPLVSPGHQILVLDQQKILSEQLIGLLINFPDQIEPVSQRLEPEMIKYPPVSSLYSQLIIYYNKDQQLDFNSLISRFSGEQASYLNQLSLFIDKDFFMNRPDLVNHETRQITRRLKDLYLHDQLQQINADLKKAEAKSDAAAMEQLGRQFSELADKLNQL